MLKKSTTQPAASCLAQLAKDFLFHSIEAKHYSLLFNQAAGPDLLQYSPWQRFCQDQAVFHQSEALKLSVQLFTIEQAA